MRNLALAEIPKSAAPFLKYAGGKRQLLPELRKHVPKKFGTYFEPFVGGGAMFFDLCAAGRLDRKHAHLSDLNHELIETYRAVRDDIDAVIDGLRSHAKRHSEAHYYKIRAIPHAHLAGHGLDAAVAIRMIYLNRTCFNGLYRVNKKGLFNVPFGKYANPTICNEEGLRACSVALVCAHLYTADFYAPTSGAKRGDFVYCDPPYWPVSKTADFTSYTKGGFGPDDQARLAEHARKMKKKGVHVLLSNADLPIVRKLYKGFEMRRVEARRNVNSKGGKRGAVGELLIW